MRTIPGTLTAEVSARSATWGECLVLVARDGARAGFTSIDVAQTIDLGDGDDVCSGGMIVSAVTMSTGLDASFAEVQGPLGPVLTRTAVEGGRWTDADAWLVRVSPGLAGYIPVIRGKVREARIEGLRWVFEIRNQGDAFNQQLGREISAYCDAEFAEARCGKIEPWIPATVTAVTDSLRFTVSVPETYADDWFNLGRVRFLTGPLAGIVSDLIFDWSDEGGDTGSIVLFAPLPEAPEVGATLEIRRGCAKTRVACMAHGNIINNRSFPDVPGTDQVLRYPNPAT